MDVRQLEYFLAVVDHGGFTRAASALFLAQPSLSQAIRALERDLGSELFHRIGRRVVLTEAGAALIEPARAAVRSLELARGSVQSVQGLHSGRVDIAAMPSQSIEPLSGMVRRFTGRFPEVSVRVQAAFTPRDALERVRTGAAELGLLATPEPLATEDVVRHALGRQRFVLLAPPGGPFAPGTVVRRAQLAGHRLIVGQRGTGMRGYVDELRAGDDAAGGAAGGDGGAGEPGAPGEPGAAGRGTGDAAGGAEGRAAAGGARGPVVAVETEHRVAILPLVLGGVGLAVVAESWRGLAERAGALVLDLEPPAGLHISLVSRRGLLTPAAREFVAAALEGPAATGDRDRDRDGDGGGLS